jgi:hypothetical protein
MLPSRPRPCSDPSTSFSSPDAAGAPPSSGGRARHPRRCALARRASHTCLRRGGATPRGRGRRSYATHPQPHVAPPHSHRRAFSGGHPAPSEGGAQGRQEAAVAVEAVHPSSPHTDDAEAGQVRCRQTEGGAGVQQHGSAAATLDGWGRGGGPGAPASHSGQRQHARRSRG